LYRFIRSVLVLILVLSFSVLLQAQSPAESVTPAKPNPPDETNTAVAPSSEALQARIERARALIAAHRLETAASELESVRAATRDSAIRTITSIMLMSVYLEEGNYGRAEALLEENYQARGAQKDETLGTYFALAGQAVIGARTHLGRYRSFAVNTNDEDLPAEAVSDLNRLRSLLERMIAQAKEISNNRRAYDSLSLLEDVLGLRLSLATDTEDQARWEVEYAKAREVLASSQTQIASLGGVPPLRPAKSPVNPGTSGSSPYSTKKTAETPLQIKAPERNDTVAPQPAPQPPAKQPSKVDEAKGQPDGTTSGETIDAGLLNAKATKKVVPRYPAIAKHSGASGLVRVHVVVDETGKVVAVSRSEGPMLLRAAAEEAARQWAFEGISVDGRPVRLSGYIDFNFTL
jgi:TonB family protein